LLFRAGLAVDAGHVVYGAEGTAHGAPDPGRAVRRRLGRHVRHGHLFPSRFSAMTDADTAGSPPPLARIVEALLFVGGEPLTADRACEIVRGLTPEDFADTIDALNRDYRRQGRPYSIQPSAGGYEMALRPAFRQVRERLQGGARETRLSQAA